MFNSSAARLTAPGFSLSMPVRKSQVGNLNHNWKGGFNSDRGRVLVHVPDHPYATKQGYVYRYRLVLEKKLGRYLRPDEIVHHEGGVADDTSDKLKLMSQSQHARLHFAKTSPEMVLRIRELAKMMKCGSQVSLKKIAEETGVPWRRVCAIVHHETWKDL